MNFFGFFAHSWYVWLLQSAFLVITMVAQKLYIGLCFLIGYLLLLSDRLHHSPANQSSGHVTAATATLGPQSDNAVVFFYEVWDLFWELGNNCEISWWERKRFIKKLGTNWWFEQLSNSRIWKKSTRQWGELTVSFNGELRWHFWHFLFSFLANWCNACCCHHHPHIHFSISSWFFCTSAWVLVQEFSGEMNADPTQMCLKGRYCYWIFGFSIFLYGEWYSSPCFSLT